MPSSDKVPNGNAVEDIIESSVGKNSVIVVNVKFARKTREGKNTKRSMPDSFVLDLPERITMFEDKNSQQYLDLIETFVYNTLSKKFQTDVWSCQIWLP